MSIAYLDPRARQKAAVREMSGMGLAPEQVWRRMQAYEPYDQEIGAGGYDLGGMTFTEFQREFAADLEAGPIDAALDVARSVHKAAVEGDMRAATFWLKHRAGWTEAVDPASVARVNVNIVGDGESARLIRQRIQIQAWIASGRPQEEWPPELREMMVLESGPARQGRSEPGSDKQGRTGRTGSETGLRLPITALETTASPEVIAMMRDDDGWPGEPEPEAPPTELELWEEWVGTSRSSRRHRAIECRYGPYVCRLMFRVTESREAWREWAGPDPGAVGVPDAEGSQRAQTEGPDPGAGGVSVQDRAGRAQGSCLDQIAQARAQDDAWGYRLSEQDMRVLDTLIANYEARG